MAQSRWLPPILLLLGLCGCSSGPYWDLASEDDLSPLAALQDAAVRQPSSLTRVPTRIGDGPVVHVTLHETGVVSAGRIVVLLHGCLSDHHTWRFVRGALGEDHCLFLVDLPGCGDSDRPDPATLGPNGYSPDALAERVLQALEANLVGPGEQRPITLVGHSLGGAIVLRAMGNTRLRSRHDSVLRRVDRIVLIAPMDVEMVNPPAALRRLAAASGAAILLADFTGVLDRELAEATIRSVDNPRRALREEVDRLKVILGRRDTRRATQAILRQAVPHRADGPDWPAIEAMTADYANVEVPCVLVWGAHDQTIPVAIGHKLQDQIPTAELYVLDDCRHSPQLEHPVRCAEIIREFSLTGSAWFHRAEALATGPPTPPP
jgi:pimeloyl-ACP methyl ester carboxylesterase